MRVPASLPYAGKRRTRAEVADFFAAIPRVDDIHVFEPREFIDAGEHVVVLGWEKTTALDTNKLYETEWFTFALSGMTELFAGEASSIRPHAMLYRQVKPLCLPG